MNPSNKDNENDKAQIASELRRYTILVPIYYFFAFLGVAVIWWAFDGSIKSVVIREWAGPRLVILIISSIVVSYATHFREIVGLARQYWRR